MSASSAATSSTVWFLVGPYASTEPARHSPIFTFPFLIGRRPELPLSLSSNQVSSTHAEITEVEHSIVLRDLGSTNGTYVNGRRLTEPAKLTENDFVQFGNVPFRLRKLEGLESPHTVQENACDQALALVQFDKLMAEHSVTPYLQPIVCMDGQEVVAYEVLARSPLFGLQTPAKMFSIAAQLNLEVELSTMLRWEGMQASLVLSDLPHLFFNTHPRELANPELVASLEALRENWPKQPLTLEIHQSAIDKGAQLADLRGVLKRLNIDLAYDGFGIGQSRLNTLAEVTPNCVKFDMSLIRGIDSATAQRQQLLATLVHMVGNLGITTLAEGVETAAEHATCGQMGFDLGQGYLYGRPAAPQHFLA
jgi:EAL domain-containing protein (putative c-di-GMP-specific phosphodiesterase class I)